MVTLPVASNGLAQAGGDSSSASLAAGARPLAAFSVPPWCPRSHAHRSGCSLAGPLPAALPRGGGVGGRRGRPAASASGGACVCEDPGGGLGSSRSAEQMTSLPSRVRRRWPCGGRPRAPCAPRRRDHVSANVPAPSKALFVMSGMWETGVTPSLFCCRLPLLSEGERALRPLGP